MISALRRLQTVYQLAPIEDEKRDNLATFKISHRQKPGLFFSLLMTHPPLEERIAALERSVR
jgi:heat shock protein HtpX